jgi:hypothetical protein
LSWASARETPTKFYEAKIRERDFGLDIVSTS